MMPWDWIGIVMIRSDTRCRTSTNGMIIRSPGWRKPSTLPSRNRTPCSYCLTIFTAITSPSRTMTRTVTRGIMVRSVQIADGIVHLGQATVRLCRLSTGPAATRPPGRAADPLRQHWLPLPRRPTAAPRALPDLDPQGRQQDRHAHPGHHPGRRPAPADGELPPTTRNHHGTRDPRAPAGQSRPDPARPLTGLSARALSLRLNLGPGVMRLS